MRRWRFRAAVLSGGTSEDSVAFLAILAIATAMAVAIAILSGVLVRRALGRG